MPEGIEDRVDLRKIGMHERHAVGIGGQALLCGGQRRAVAVHADETPTLRQAAGDLTGMPGAAERPVEVDPVRADVQRVYALPAAVRIYVEIPSDPDLFHQCGQLLGGDIGLFLLVALCRPDLSAAGLPEEIDLLLDPGILAEIVRQQEAALLVRLTADDVGKERAQAAGLGRRRSLAALDDALPLLLGIDRQAGVQ